MLALLVQPKKVIQVISFRWVMTIVNRSITVYNKMKERKNGKKVISIRIVYDHWLIHCIAWVVSHPLICLVFLFLHWFVVLQCDWWDRIISRGCNKCLPNGIHCINDASTANGSMNCAIYLWFYRILAIISETR